MSQQDLPLCALIVRFVAQQLPLLAQYIEDQALVIVSEFKELAEKTQEHSQHIAQVIEIASQIEVEGEVLPYEKSIDLLYEPLAEAIDKILDVSKLSMSMVINIGNAADNITRMETAIAQVQDLTKQTNMLAMNTQIEAARTGEVGYSFRIIAQEVKALSERIKMVSSDIKKEVGSVAISVRRSSALVDSLAHYDMTENLQLRDKVGELIESILKQNQHFSQLLHDASESSAQTAQSIQNLVVGIQFQDRSSQISGDLCALLNFTAEKLEACGGASTRLDDAQLGQLEQQMKLSDVKQGLFASLAKQGMIAHSAAQVAVPAAPVEDDIELF